MPHDHPKPPGEPEGEGSEPSSDVSPPDGSPSRAGRTYSIPEWRLIELLMESANATAWMTRAENLGVSIKKPEVDPVPLILDAIGVPPADDEDDERSPASVARDWYEWQLYGFDGTVDDAYALLDQLVIEAAKMRAGRESDAGQSGPPSTNGDGSHT